MKMVAFPSGKAWKQSDGPAECFLTLDQLLPKLRALLTDDLDLARGLERKVPSRSFPQPSTSIGRQNIHTAVVVSILEALLNT